MVDVVFVADAFLEEIPQGGAELANREVTDFLTTQNFVVEEVQGFKITKTYLEKRKSCLFILGGFLSIPKESLKTLENLNYLLYEHDHKYCYDRNPAKHINFKVPENQLVFVDLYKNAKKVLCQSQFHLDIIQKNLPFLNNLHNMKGSFWSDEFLKSVGEYCDKNNLEYDLISEPTPLQLFHTLTRYEYFVFLPQSPETFSRVFMEAKLAGCKIITNEMVGAAGEDYTYSDQSCLLREVHDHKRKSLKDISQWVKKYKILLPETSLEVKEPLISIITSVFKGEEFIEKFLEEIVQQSIFSQSELIFIDCNDDWDSFEQRVIHKYREKYSNIYYHRVEKDPGVYGAWNIAIEKSSGKYITNANLDDRRSYDNLELCLKLLKASPEIDLVYSPFLVTNQPNETFYTTKSRHLFETHEYDKRLMHKCLPGCMPMWRRDIHNKNGYFSEEYSSAGDLEFWLRCVKNGSLFKRVPHILGLYYHNPSGLSTSILNHEKKVKEEQKILIHYKELFV